MANVPKTRLKLSFLTAFLSCAARNDSEERRHANEFFPL